MTPPEGELPPELVPETVLQFWFGQLEDGVASPAQRQLWFVSDPEFDARCTAEFASWLSAAAEGQLDAWLENPRTTLAFIVLCDQLPRNIHRGTAQAFAWDPLALRAAHQGIEAGFDQTLAWDERAFFYMPFEHSERVLDQHLAVGLFTSLRDQIPTQHKSNAGNNLRFAQQHRDIILRFGRFPHRNAVLDRTSTAEELTYIADSDGFGQNP